ncbi:MAG: hypothetical protein ACE5FK_04590 [Candidatus Methylomirabilia bacterium]
MRGLRKTVGLFSMFLQGCAAVPGGHESLSVPGRFVTSRGKPGLVIGAPHGGTDDRTTWIGREVAAKTGFSLVLATGFTSPNSPHWRFNVNRPTEGIPGRPATEERYTEEARGVYERYIGQVRGVSQGPIRLYVELHGNTRQESAGRIEIATMGVDRLGAWKLKTLFELTRDSYLGSRPEVPRLEVLVEPLDRVVLTASSAKQIGILRLPRQAMHIELPRAARTSAGEVYAQILAEFVQEASKLLLERGQ